MQCSAKTQDNLKKVFDTAVNVGKGCVGELQCVLEYRAGKDSGCTIA